MDIALIFGGVVVSLVVQFVKSYFKTNTAATMLVVVGLSLVGGVGYMALLHFGLWQSFLQVLVAAGAFYAFILKNVTDATKPSVDGEAI